MEDGYYWARDKTDTEWVVLEVYDGEVYHHGVETYYNVSEYEFGDRIEIPSKYRKGDK